MPDNRPEARRLQILSSPVWLCLAREAGPGMCNSRLE